MHICIGCHGISNESDKGEVIATEECDICSSELGGLVRSLAEQVVALQKRVKEQDELISALTDRNAAIAIWLK